MNIQWYPGHMTKTKRMLATQLSLVDVVIELLDARIPFSSRNPDLEHMAQNKHRIIILTKTDLANPSVSKQWAQYYKQSGHKLLPLDARKKNDALKVIDIARACMKEKADRAKQRGRVGLAVRALVVGIPNVGKSTFINTLSGRAGAATADKPGVTRGRQWVNVQPGFDLLDTPGILWPKFDDPQVGLRLAATGAVSDEVVDKITLCEHLLAMLTDISPSCLAARYKITCEPTQPRVLLERIGNARGFKLKGGQIDLERTAVMVLDEFRGGRLGRISLESPEGVNPLGD